MPTPKLKACPYCGHSAEVCTMWFLEADPDERKNLRVVCTFCGAIGPETWDAGFAVEGEEALVELWNRRAPVHEEKVRRDRRKCIHWERGELCFAYDKNHAHKCLGVHGCIRYAVKEGESPVMQGLEQKGGQP